VYPKPSWAPATIASKSLTRNGTPRSGPSGRSLGRLARLVEHGVGDGVDLRVDRLDAGNGGLDQFQRGNLAAAHQFGQAEGVVLLIFGKSRHDRSLRQQLFGRSI
jgi:hypothetical protein